MTELSARDRKAAQVWLMKMLDDPVRHGKAFDRWAAGAPERLAYYESLLDEVQVVDRAARSLHAERRRTRPARPASFTMRPALALLLVGAISIPLIAGLYWVDHRPPGPMEVSSRDYTTQIGEVRTDKLPDGSTAILDTNSEISVGIDDQQRQVELKRGRVRFIVAHDGDRPFIVRAGESQVIATGTTFDVSLRGGLVVHLLDGGVDVALAPGVSSTATYHLTPGQQLSLKNDTGLPPSPIVSTAGDSRWTSGARRFDDIPIAQVIAEANSYSRKRIILANPAWGDRRIFGDINIRSEEAVAKALADYLELRVDRSQPDALILVSPN